MPFQPPVSVPHVIRALADIQVGCCIKMSVGTPSDNVIQECRISFVEMLENGGLAVEMDAVAKGQALKLVVVFIVTGHPLFLSAKAVRGIHMVDYYGDLVRFVEFSDTKIPHTLAPGVYPMYPGTLLVTEDRAFRCSNGVVTEVEDFTNLTEADGTFKVGKEFLKPDAPAVGEGVSRTDKFIENDVFALLDGNTWSVHKRRAHGIEPLLGARTTLASIKKATTPRVIYPLTRPARALKVGDVLTNDTDAVRILKLKTKSVEVLWRKTNAATALDAGCKVASFEVLGDGTEFGGNSINIDGTAATLTDEPIQFPDEFVIPDDMLRHGNVIETAIGNLAMRSIGVQSETVAILIGDTGRIQMTRRDDTWIARLFGAAIRLGPVTPPVVGGLYSAPWSSHGNAVFDGKAFAVMNLSSAQTVQRANPVNARPVKFVYDSDGRAYLSGNEAFQPPVLIAPPGRWVLSIPMDTSPRVHLIPEGQSPPITTWEVSSTIDTDICRRDGTIQRGRLDHVFAFPVLSSDMETGVSPIPLAVARILNFRCSSCNTRCAFADSVPITNSNNQISRMCATCTTRLAQRCECCRTWVTNGGLDSNDRCRLCVSFGNVTLVHSYSYKPTAKWHGEGPLFYGTEVELEQRDTSSDTRISAAKVRQLIGDAWYAKTDGSIRHGLEFVSHPFSLKYLLDNKDKYRALFASINEFMEARENCGIHIHTSKEGYAVKIDSIPEISDKIKMSKTRLIQRGLLRAQKFIYGNPKLAIHFAGRQSSYANLSLAKTCTGRGLRGIANPQSRDGTAGVIGAAMGQRKANRYEAMNFTDHTVEFRLFKTTTCFDEYLRNVLFVDSVIQYARSHAMPKAGAPSTALWRKFLLTQPYYAPVIDHFDSWVEKPLAAAAK